MDTNSLNSIEQIKEEIKSDTIKIAPGDKSYKKFKRPKKVKNPEDKFNFKSKKFIFGLGKEFGRIHWASKKTVFINLIVVSVIILFLSFLFLGIDYLVLNVIKIK